jgi:hypothetical protein
MKWVARRGLLRNPAEAGASNAPPELSPAEALATATEITASSAVRSIL